MAFEELNVKRPGAPLNGVRLGTNKSMYRCSLGADVLSALGVEHGDRISIAVGSGSDVNTIRLQKSEVGFLPKRSKGQKSIMLQFWRKTHDLPNWPVKNTACEYEIRDGALYITLPSADQLPKAAE